MANLNISPLFAVPIAKARWDKADQFNPQLADLFRTLEVGGQYEETLTPTNRVNIFESKMELFSRSEPAIQALRQFCLGNIMAVVAATTGRTPAQMQQLRLKNHAWFHITRKGGYISYHNHPNASWSAVYYVDTGTKPAEFPQSGHIRFFNPNIGNKMFKDPGNSDFKAPFEQGTVAMEPQAGNLIVFPSYLMHEVAPFMGDDERICVAMNCWFE